MAEVRRFFLPSRFCEASVLQEGAGDHGHQDVILPKSFLEVIKPQLLFQLLMRLFANPSCFDGGG